MGAAGRSGLYRGAVMHRRHRPFGHKFRYRIFSCLFDLEEAARLSARSRLFGFNRGALVSFHERDHGPRDGSPLRPWLKQKLKAAGIETGEGRIEVLCFPRLFGYVFNPIAVWFAYDERDMLRAVLYEVTNTFRESVSYLIPVAGEVKPGDGLSHSCAKGLHVSPFMPLSGAYDFRLRVPDETYSLAIRYRTHEGDMLLAAQTGAYRPLTDGELLKAVVAYPLMTLKVIGAIHFEALRLWLKGAKYIKKPARPAGAIVVPGGRAQAAE